MKKTLLLIAGLLLAASVYPQGQKPIMTIDKLNLNTRADFTLDYRKGSENALSTFDHGFAGKYLVVGMDGSIGSRFTYHLRQRLNTPNIGFANTFFQGTDWAYLNWNFTDNFYLSAGKQVVAIGGWEYDTNPIDIYYGTEFWNKVCCYEVGASINYLSNSGKHLAMFQICNSPFIYEAMQSLYAYNLMWYGDFGKIKTAYSVNMIEYEQGRYINYISLGNKYKYGRYELYLDLLNRASFAQDHFFGQDFTAIFGMGVDIGRRWIVFGKVGYDYNQAQLPNTDQFDLYVTPGTKVDFESVGFEFYPMGDRSLRLHLCGSHTSVDGAHKFQANVGLTWKVDLLHAITK